MLESAVHSIDGGFGGIERYPGTQDKSARLAFAIIINHPFVDGNKRIGILAMLATLRLNEVKISYTQQELIALGLGIADGTMGYDSILEWIHSYS